MRINFILGCGAAFLAVTVGCGSSSSSGGAGGTGVTTGSATTAVTSTHTATVTSSTHAAGTGSATGGAGGSALQCNPVVDTQCNVAGGEACDFDGNGGFTCFNMPANTAAVCASCDDMAGPACKDGSSCLFADASGNTSKCAKYCCTDADCGGAAGSCALDGSTVGFCGVDGVATTTTTSSASGAGGGSAFFVPQCTGIPTTPPSGGTCGAP